MEGIDFSPLVNLSPSLWSESAAFPGAWIYAPGIIGILPDREKAASLILKFGNLFMLHGADHYCGLSFNDCLYFCRSSGAESRSRGALWRITWGRIECVGSEKVRILSPEDWPDAT